jgi:hypothetical protein
MGCPRLRLVEGNKSFHPILSPTELPKTGRKAGKPPAIHPYDRDVVNFGRLGHCGPHSSRSVHWTAQRADPTKPSQGYVSSAEAAARIGYSVNQINYLARSGRLRGRFVGKRWFINERALDAFVANRKSQAKRGRPIQRR